MSEQAVGARWAALLFDLDGTLADTAPLILTCYRHTMRQHLGAERPDAEWLCTMGRPRRDQMTAFAASPAELEAMLRTYSAHQLELHDAYVHAYRNGHLGIAQWGGWVWSGDTNATWKTLEGQIAVGINHSLSVGPYWGSDTGGFYPTAELTGELYARWFQFSAFTPSFRSHGRIWRLRLPGGGA